MPASVYSGRYRGFVKKLVEARTKSGVTQVELAKRLGWTQSTISKVERGERRLDIVEFLTFAEALKLDAVDMVRWLQSGKGR